VRRLADSSRRLDELRLFDLDVRGRVERIYSELRELRPAFRKLALLDVPDFGAWAAAAVLELPEREAEDVLEQLVELGLLIRTGTEPAAPQRYGLHELVLLYGRERAAEEDSAQERQAVLDRALRAWLGSAKEADAALLDGPLGAVAAAVQRAPARTRGEVILLPSAAAGRLSTVGTGLASNPLGWLDAEADAMIALFGQACESGGHRLAMELALTLRNFFALRQRRLRPVRPQLAFLPEQTAERVTA
jgi:hypothetical protein